MATRFGCTCNTPCYCTHIQLLGHWIRTDVCNSIVTGQYFISLRIWNLNGKLFLNGHDQLYGIQAVQPKIFLKHRRWRNLQRYSTLYAHYT